MLARLTLELAWPMLELEELHPLQVAVERLSSEQLHPLQVALEMLSLEVALERRSSVPA